MHTTLTIMQVASVLGISIQETRRLVRERQLRIAAEFSKQRRWPKFNADDVLAYIKRTSQS